MKPLSYSTHCSPAPTLRSLERFDAVNTHMKFEHTTGFENVRLRFLFVCSGPGSGAELGLADGGADL